MRYAGLGVALDCIKSWSSPPKKFVLSNNYFECNIFNIISLQFHKTYYAWFMLFDRSLLYLTTKETWHILCVNFLVVNEYTLVSPLRKVEQRYTKMLWDYSKSWTNFRRKLSKRHITPKINFRRNKKSSQNSPETALVWFFVISLTSSERPNNAYTHCSTQKPIFIFLTSILRYQCFMSF